MAYQPYPYNGYQPNAYYPGPVPDQLAQLRQNQMQPPVMSAAPMPGAASMQAQPANLIAGSTQNGMIWVSGRQEADGYLIAPNSAVALWDQNNPVVYLRQAASTGKPSTKVYDLVERTDGPLQQQAAPQIDLTQYITRDELESILAERLKKPSKPAKIKEEE